MDTIIRDTDAPLENLNQAIVDSRGGESAEMFRRKSTDVDDDDAIALELSFPNFVCSVVSSLNPSYFAYMLHFLILSRYLACL